MVKFTAAGYVCIDYYPDFNNRYYVTGNGVDVLFNLLDLRQDVTSSVVSAISDDEYGKASLEAFQKRGIDCSHLDIIPGGATPSVPLHLINNDRVHGDPVRGVMGNYEFSEEAIDFICQHDIMHSDFTGKLIPRLEEIHKRGVQIYFDLSTRRNDPDAKHILSNIDCGLVSFDGTMEEGKEYLRYACSLGTKVMIATFGEQGSLAYDGEKFYRGDIVPVKEVVNTVGAGDSYFAGFISGMIDHKPIDECMYEGAKRSAKVIGTFDPYL
ncbi:MAG: PfkB family carbohydrate kinase [Eubacteriales bacterium]|nr:PfkB family carbohydrate kinase [Eubacteriales bacterium]